MRRPSRLAPVLALLALAAPVAVAQTAAEVLVVASSVAALDSTLVLKLPVGSGLYKDPRAATDLAGRLLGAGAFGYTGFQLYVSRGLATALAEGFLANMTTQLAAAGYLQTGSSPVRLGGETWTRAEFADDGGGTALLFVARRPDGVYMLTARGR